MLLRTRVTPILVALALFPLGCAQQPEWSAPVSSAPNSSHKSDAADFGALEDDYEADERPWEEATPSAPPPASAPMPAEQESAGAAYDLAESAPRASRRAERRRSNSGTKLKSKRARGDVAAPQRTAPVPMARPSSEPSRPNQALPRWHDGMRQPYDQVARHTLPSEAFSDPRVRPYSTFSTDVDTASYTLARSRIARGALPDPGLVRVEEFLNYFNYEPVASTVEGPMAVHTEVGPCPWSPDTRLVRVNVAAQAARHQINDSRNFVFLLDVSGSMNSRDKLPLLQRGLSNLVQTLDRDDTISIVAYAGASGVVLPPTAGSRRSVIRRALRNLDAGGSTNGAAGIQLAYSLARQRFVPGGVNRVILATDGDFNVGTQSPAALEQLIERERASGVFLTVLGFGQSGMRDDTMESLADHGNGNYAFIDSAAEAERVLVREGAATLHTAAKDVKLQVEFNPDVVQAYRLVGYDNRRLADRDFNDDRKDAGDMGDGDTVTALYEVVLHGRGHGPIAPPWTNPATAMASPSLPSTRHATAARPPR